MGIERVTISMRYEMCVCCGGVAGDKGVLREILRKVFTKVGYFS
jgi:hypothetical protein